MIRIKSFADGRYEGFLGVLVLTFRNVWRLLDMFWSGYVN